MYKFKGLEPFEEEENKKQWKYLSHKCWSLHVNLTNYIICIMELIRVCLPPNLYRAMEIGPSAAGHHLTILSYVADVPGSEGRDTRSPTLSHVWGVWGHRNCMNPSY